MDELIFYDCVFRSGAPFLKDNQAETRFARSHQISIIKQLAQPVQLKEKTFLNN